MAGAFGGDIDDAMLVKIYGESANGRRYDRKHSPAQCRGTRKVVIEGNPSRKAISTSHIERHNLSMRMHMRRFTRLTNAFSKKIENHVHMVALYTFWYNLMCVHGSLRVTPAMEAGLTDTMDMEEFIAIMDDRAPKPKPRGPYSKRNSN
ncbi:MAG: IS1 family transposase [Rhodobacteraceae bacterium]|nr:IS1 family transposase [Paracoccaceae bacterium]MCY4197583.1 IS1 family transposase [Paracoccaceae bacterium]